MIFRVIEGTSEIVIKDNTLVIGSNYIAGSEGKLSERKDEVKFAEDNSDRKIYVKDVLPKM